MPKITFILPDKTKKEVDVAVGVTLLEAAHSNDVLELEGACGGALACSTCHLVLPQETFDKLDAASEDEEDMLDLAYGLTPTSRLGCQVVVTEAMNGLEVIIPGSRQDFCS